MSGLTIPEQAPTSNFWIQSYQLLKDPNIASPVYFFPMLACGAANKILTT